MDYSPKCLKILELEAAWQLLYQLEEWGPSWLGRSHHIVPWLADGHLTVFKGLCSSFLHVCSTDSPSSHLGGVGRSFPGVSITSAHGSEVWEMWRTTVPGKGWMMALVEAWEQVLWAFKHWNLDLWIVKWWWEFKVWHHCEGRRKCKIFAFFVNPYSLDYKMQTKERMTINVFLMPLN